MEYYSIPAQKKKDILHPKVVTQQSCLPFVPKSIAENTSRSIYGKRRKKVLLNVSYILCSMPHLSFCCPSFSIRPAMKSSTGQVCNAIKHSLKLKGKAKSLIIEASMVCIM